MDEEALHQQGGRFTSTNYEHTHTSPLHCKRNVHNINLHPFVCIKYKSTLKIAFTLHGSLLSQLRYLFLLNTVVQLQ